MSDRVLTEKIKAEVLNDGMDLVGFAPVSRWEHAPFMLSPKAILPESKTVIVAAIHITDTWTEMGGEPEPQDKSPGGWMDQNGMMDRISYKISRILHEQGHKAIPVVASNIWRYRKYEGIPSLFAPDLSHIHAATAAGLAEIGWSGLAITPEFGSRCRFFSIVTSAELVPTPMYDGPKLCDMCMKCVKHCPSGALKKELGKPHEVNIGGKIFKYANKNMWRCAWAEHFNLNLNSETIKKAVTINEEVILDELKAKGYRGHERGVCQKYCVPPHLRTREPSFGRPDKFIAQNRINKRYPENMPTLRKMRDDICAAAIRMGVDLAVVVPLRQDAEVAREVNHQAPGMRTIIAVAMRIPSETFESEKFGTAAKEPFQFAMHRQLHFVLLKLARIVEDYGYHAASFTGTIWNRNDIAYKLGEMAGLGRLNASGAFETPEFGINLIAGAVTTDALIDPSPRTEKTENTSGRIKLNGRSLRSKLERLAEDNLVSMFGVTPADRFDKTVEDLKAHFDEKELGEDIINVAKTSIHGNWVSKIVNENVKIMGPRGYMPDAKSVIVMGMHFPRELIENTGLAKTQQIGTYNFWQFQTIYELRHAAAQTALFLNDMGYKAIATENMLGIGSRTDSPRGRIPDARSNAIEAVAAGLGQIGESGALLNPKFGPHQRRIVIITNAELPDDEIYTGPEVCRHCGACKEKCPMNPFEGDHISARLGDKIIQIPKIERRRCDWAKKYSLCPEEGPGLIGNKTNVPAPKSRIRIKDIAAACEKKDPVMVFRTCIIENCMRYCPAGELAATR